MLQQQKGTLKKPVRLTSFQNPIISICFNIFQVCPSVPNFVFALLLISSFNVLSDYFYVSLSLVAVHTVRTLKKIGNTASLKLT